MATRWFGASLAGWLLLVPAHWLTGCADEPGPGEPAVTDGGHGAASGDADTDAVPDATADTTDAADGHEKDGSTPDAALKCQAEQAKLVAFVKASKSCTQDSDCVHVPSRSDIREHCSGGVYGQCGYDKTEFSELESEVYACLGPESGACAEYPLAPLCWTGTCVSSAYGTDTRDSCLAQHGGETPCRLCFCGLCFPLCQSECVPLFECARAAGCLGAPACDPSSPGFPCQSVLQDAASYPAIVEQYKGALACLADWQCLDLCAGN